MKKPDFHAWYYGPKGESQVFYNEADVPKGWKDHPTKHKKSEPGQVIDGQEQQTVDDMAGLGQSSGGQLLTDNISGKAGDETGDLDKGGWPWDPSLHAATKSKTKDAYWRMKVGVARPDPKKGYPLPGDKPALDL